MSLIRFSEKQIREIGEHLEAYAIETLQVDPPNARLMRAISEGSLRKYFGTPRAKPARRAKK